MTRAAGGDRHSHIKGKDQQQGDHQYCPPGPGAPIRARRAPEQAYPVAQPADQGNSRDPPGNGPQPVWQEDVHEAEGSPKGLPQLGQEFFHEETPGERPLAHVGGEDLFIGADPQQISVDKLVAHKPPPAPDQDHPGHQPDLRPAAPPILFSSWTQKQGQPHHRGQQRPAHLGEDSGGDHQAHSHKGGWAHRSIHVIHDPIEAQGEEQGHQHVVVDRAGHVEKRGVQPHKGHSAQRRPGMVRDQPGHGFVGEEEGNPAQKHAHQPQKVQGQQRPGPGRAVRRVG